MNRDRAKIQDSEKNERHKARQQNAKNAQPIHRNTPILPSSSPHSLRCLFSSRGWQDKSPHEDDSEANTSLVLLACLSRLGKRGDVGALPSARVAGRDTKMANSWRDLGRIRDPLFLLAWVCVIPVDGIACWARRARGIE